MQDYNMSGVWDRRNAVTKLKERNHLYDTGAYFMYSANGKVTDS